jgi:hypothetical protein
MLTGHPTAHEVSERIRETLIFCDQLIDFNSMTIGSRSESVFFLVVEWLIQMDRFISFTTARYLHRNGFWAFDYVAQFSSETRSPMWAWISALQEKFEPALLSSAADILPKFDFNENSYSSFIPFWALSWYAEASQEQKHWLFDRWISLLHLYSSSPMTQDYLPIYTQYAVNWLQTSVNGDRLPLSFDIEYFYQSLYHQNVFKKIMGSVSLDSMSKIRTELPFQPVVLDFDWVKERLTVMPSTASLDKLRFAVLVRPLLSRVEDMQAYMEIILSLVYQSKDTLTLRDQIVSSEVALDVGQMVPDGEERMKRFFELMQEVMDDYYQRHSHYELMLERKSLRQSGFMLWALQNELNIDHPDAKRWEGIIQAMFGLPSHAIDEIE